VATIVFRSERFRTRGAAIHERSFTNVDRGNVEWTYVACEKRRWQQATRPLIHATTGMRSRRDQPEYISRRIDHWTTTASRT
jgi:hypothetical protein